MIQTPKPTKKRSCIMKYKYSNDDNVEMMRDYDILIHAKDNVFPEKNGFPPLLSS